MTTQIADLADDATPAALVDAAVATYGRLDTIVHAAVDHGQGRLEQLTTEQWTSAYVVNVRAAVWLVRAAVPHLAAAPNGSAVLFSSIQAQAGRTGTSLYGSTKGAIEALTRHLAVELGPRGIRVNAISPGYVPPGPDPAATALPMYPLGRYGRAEDIASVAVFLASDGASWTTGAIVAVDGGIGALHPAHVANAVVPTAASAVWRARMRRIRRFGGRNRP